MHRCQALLTPASLPASTLCDTSTGLDGSLCSRDSRTVLSVFSSADAIHRSNPCPASALIPLEIVEAGSVVCTFLMV